MFAVEILYLEFECNEQFEAHLKGMSSHFFSFKPWKIGRSSKRIVTKSKLNVNNWCIFNKLKSERTKIVVDKFFTWNWIEWWTRFEGNKGKKGMHTRDWKKNVGDFPTTAKKRRKLIVLMKRETCRKCSAFCLFFAFSHSLSRCSHFSIKIMW